jgi:hypothetical protein
MSILVLVSSRVRKRRHIRITGYSDDFEPFKVRGEQWLQFGPGLAATKSDLEAFATGLAKLQANTAYVNELEKKP